MADIVRVIRVYEFEGERELVEATIEHSLKDGTNHRIAAWRDSNKYGGYAPPTITIRVATLGDFPKVVASDEREQAPGA